MTAKVCVIVNPASGKGRGAKAAAEVRRAFGAMGITDIRTTRAKGDERTVALRAIEDGASTIVAVGGDGTWGNVANAILTSGADVRLALGAAGTGNDFAKTVGAPARDFDATARLAVEGPDTRVDVGCIEGKYFLNVTGFGFDIAVIEDVERIRWLKGDLVYTYSALRQLFGYRGIPIGVAAAERANVTGAASGDTRAAGAANPAGQPGHDMRPHLMLIIANGKNFGGTFRIAPGASITDGRLDAVSIDVAPPLRRMKLFAAATKGTHVAEDEVRTEQAPCFTLSFPAPPAYETDGEYNRASSATLHVRCVPRALRVVMPAAPTPAPARAEAEGATA